MCNPSPSVAAHRRHEDASQRTLFSTQPSGEEQTGEHSGPPTATEDLLISSPGCGRAAGSSSGATVGLGVRSQAHFTCGWVRISISSAPRQAASLPALAPPVRMQSLQTPGRSAAAC